ncbi:MAG: chemotaxis protein CheA [Oligoflexia bacterium]|nr:chemotaxis protein CheA [Oligoflexia bacterium]MBF0364339.1 chemotaxis protein CheA [Oligoflexia bacterium]
MLDAKEDKQFQERLKKIFVEEAQNLLADLEEQIVILDPERPMDILKEAIATVFNVVHSLKASTGSVGHTRLSQFLHSFEFFLDDIRKDKISINAEVIDQIILITNEVREGMLFVLNNDIDPPLEPLKFDNVVKIDSKKNAQASVVEQSAAEVTASSSLSILDEVIALEPLKMPEGKLYEINLRFGPGVMRGGNDPILYFKMLKDYGEFINLQCDSSAIPTYSKFIFDELYLSWKIHYKSAQEKKLIEDLFVFVRQESDIAINEIKQEQTTKNATATATETTTAIEAVVATTSSPAEEKTPAAEKTTTSNVSFTSKMVLTKAAKDNDEAEETTGSSSNKNAVTSIRVPIGKLDELVNVVGELVIISSQVKNIIKEIEDRKIKKNLETKNEEASRLIDDLQDRIMNVRMVPIDLIFSQFYRLVRDLSHKLKKNIKLVIFGQETELDKNIIEKISNPLKHLVRNSIDHGIETIEERKAKGKSPEATIELKAYHQEGSIFIKVSDDGKGLDKERIYKKALEKGLINEGQNLSDSEIYNLVFVPGFSTAKEVTDISGRGVGMDIVKKAVNELRGDISLETQKDIGTTFCIRLPLTVSIIDGLLFQVGAQIYIIPILSIDETLNVQEKQVHTLDGNREVVSVHGVNSNLVRLHHLFKIPTGITEATKGIIINISINGKKFSLLADSILGQQQTVIKSLDKNFEKVAGVTGATILGNGDIAIIVDPSEIVELHKKSIPYLKTLTQKNIN